MRTSQSAYQSRIRAWFPLLALLAFIDSTVQCVEAQPVRVSKRPPVDPIDAITGEQYLQGGVVPPGRTDYSPPAFRQLDADTLWREIEKSKGLAVIGFREAGQPRGYFRGKVLVTDRQVAGFARTLKAQLPGLSSREVPRLPMPKMSDGKLYPAVIMRIANIQTLEELRRKAMVEFVEPLYFYSSSSCGDYTAKQRGATVDGKISPPEEMPKPPAMRAFDVVPYTYAHLGIDKAWKRMARPGAGIRVAVLDTGTSPLQDQLNDRFTMPANIRPPAQHLNATTDPAGGEGACFHGTRIAGTIAAPLDGRNIVGIAWAAPLTTIRVAGGVLHIEGSSIAVCNSLYTAKAIGARVFSMAWGMLYTSEVLERCITDVWETPPEVIMVAPTGTYVPWIVFPASMERGVIAASQVEISPTGHGYSMLPHAQVGYGRRVDFVLPISINDAPTTGEHSPDIVTLGGTSSATAHLAGMFAVLWAKYPNDNRDQIISRMRASSTLENITDQGGLPPFADLGSGMPDLYRATGGSKSLEIRVQDEVQAGSIFSVEAIVDGSSPLHFSWTPGGATAKEVLMTAPASSGVMTLSVSASDPVDWNNLQASKTIRVTPSPPPPPQERFLWSVQTIHEYPVFFDGNRLDRKINPGERVPPGCVVLEAVGQLMSSPTALMPGVSASPSFSQGWTRGYAVRLDEVTDLRSLQANVHVWHDGLNDVRVRVRYRISEPAGTDCNDVRLTQTSPT